MEKNNDVLMNALKNPVQAPNANEYGKKYLNGTLYACKKDLKNKEGKDVTVTVFTFVSDDGREIKVSSLSNYDVIPVIYDYVMKEVK